MRTVVIREGTIRLGQFLKLADLIDVGGEAKSLLADGAIRVNGDVETRRGRQMSRGDVVTVNSQQVRVG
ncbi:MAG: RNA-binding S4 domain-containing protein [Jatrophihabitans sp.]